MTLDHFNKYILPQTPEVIYLLRFEEITPFGKTYYNGISYIDFEGDNEDECKPTLITEEPVDESNAEIVGYVDIQEFNLAIMAIMANSIKRRYDL